MRSLFFIPLLLSFPSCGEPCGVPTLDGDVVIAAERCPDPTGEICELTPGQAWGPCPDDGQCGTPDSPGFCLHSAGGAVCVEFCTDDCLAGSCGVPGFCDGAGSCLAACAEDDDCPAVGMFCDGSLGACSWPL